MYIHLRYVMNVDEDVGIDIGTDTIKDRAEVVAILPAEGLTNKKAYDLMIEGVRDRFVRKVHKVDLILPESIRLQEDTDSFTHLLKVYDNVGYGKHKSLDQNIELMAESDSLFDQAMYRNMLEDIMGPVRLKSFFFTENNILRQIDMMEYKKKDMRKMSLLSKELDKDRSSRSDQSSKADKTRIIHNLQSRMKSKIVKYTKVEQNPIADVVSKFYNINKADLIADQIKYYFIRQGFQYAPFYALYQSPNIVESDKTSHKMINELEPFDYIGALRDIAAYNSPDAYYTELLNRISVSDSVKSNKQKRIDELGLSVEDADFLCLNYVKYRPQVFILTVWQYGTKHIDKLIKKLEADGKVYYVRKYNLPYNTIEGVMFWLYDEFSFEKRTDFIRKKMEYAGYEKNKNGELTVIVFDNISNLPIAGQAAKYKIDLRDTMVEAVLSESSTKTKQTDSIRGNDIIHINDYHYQSVEYSKLYFNANTIKMLGVQDRSLYLHSSNFTSNLMMQTIRSYLYHNANHNEMDRFIMFGSMAMYALGIRRNTDIDAAFIDIRQPHITADKNDHHAGHDQHEKSNKSNKEELFVRKIEYGFMSKSKFVFVDAGIPSSKLWKESWSLANVDWFDMTSKMGGPKSLTDMVTNPAHHFYFQGFKVCLIEYEITKKILRSKAYDTMDLIYLYEFAKNTILETTIQKLYSIRSDAEIEQMNKAGVLGDPLKYTDIIAKSAGIHGKAGLTLGKIDKAGYNRIREFVRKVLHRRYDEHQIQKIEPLKAYKHILPD